MDEKNKNDDKNYETIHEWFNKLKRYRFSFNKKEIPKNGIYILFEEGEFVNSTDRIVRIGTHTGQNNLPNRLSEHFIKENKDRSIFRKNIGRAILNKNNDDYLPIWNLDLTEKSKREEYTGFIDIKKQKNIEKQVSKYIQSMFSFAILEINSKDIRLDLESKIISTLSFCNKYKPSKKWLGNYSPEKKIRDSGLWLKQGLWKIPLNNEDMKYIWKLINKD
jgi:hypothetical protein